MLFKNIISTRESLKTEFDKRFSGLSFKHSDLTGVGPDDHHAEKHTLENHTESELMKKLLDLINNPPVHRYIHGGGGGASNFTELLDTPNAYTSKADRIVKVNAGATGLEFGYKLTVSATEPASPATNDLWIDVS